MDAIVNHPPGAIVEYPQTGSFDGQAVAHVFPVDPTTFVNPKASFQYSLGDSHGGRPGVMCNLLRDDAGNPVICNRLKTSCKSNTIHHVVMPIISLGCGLKVCSARLHDAQIPAHSYTDRLRVCDLVTPTPSYVDTAKAEVFMKTLALFCALQEHGCSSTTAAEYADLGSQGVHGNDSESDSDTANEGDENMLHPPGASVLVQHLRQSRRSCFDENQSCKGALLLSRNQFHQHYIA